MPPFEFDVFQQGENVIALGSDAMGTDSLINCLVRSSNPIVKHQYRVHQLKLHADQLTVGKYVIYLSDAIGNVAVRELDRVYDKRSRCIRITSAIQCTTRSSSDYIESW